ncbi:radical SAM protein [Candidatus Woesearchaeota archaeon]|nr:radical SAM protein [Candidatus Woesearchaeota archaeon]
MIAGNHMEKRTKTWFERAIFLSWYCSKGDCTFCYMSIQKPFIKDPKKAVRRKESILAEAIISKVCGWRIEFLSGGYESYSIPEIAEITGQLHKITGLKQWLNIGTLSKHEIEQFLPDIEGVCGAVECINLDVRKKVCPSKPLEPIEDMLETAEKFGLKKAITIIMGLGESEDDIPLLVDFIKKHNLDRITFYALNPHKGTPFKKGPATDYYTKWIRGIRKEFPDLQIIAGSWVDRLSEIHELLEAGADAITKFPSIKLFGSRFAKQIEEEARKAGRKFEGTMTELPDIDWDKEVDKLDLDIGLKGKIKVKLKQYTKKMSDSGTR